jgi:hypothetical protein
VYAANTIEGQLDAVISKATQISSSLAGDPKDQSQLQESAYILTLQVRRLALILQMVATKDKMMSETTTF